MANLLIRNLDDRVKSRLKARAVRRGHSMEQEAREILSGALAVERAEVKGLATAIRALVRSLGGGTLEGPDRQRVREPPNFKL